jgi:hypothetical protein
MTDTSDGKVRRYSVALGHMNSNEMLGHQRVVLASDHDALLAERDSLRADNARLRDIIDRACNALTDSINVSGNDPDTNLYWVNRLRAALALGERQQEGE